jgi:hypothetical protein
MDGMKTINGKQIKVTAAGYVYADGKKIADKIATPVHVGFVYDLLDEDQAKYVNRIINNRYVMC